MASNTEAKPAKKSGRGGSRAGAGRPVKKHVEVPAGTPALDFLQQVYESPSVPMPLRIRAAAVVVGATVARPGAEKPLGKREAHKLAAQEMAAAGGQFSPGRPPLAVVARSGKP